MFKTCWLMITVDYTNYSIYWGPNPVSSFHSLCLPLTSDSGDQGISRDSRDRSRAASSHLQGAEVVMDMSFATHPFFADDPTLRDDSNREL